MILRVDRCWSGNNNHSFRVTDPKGNRCSVNNWTDDRWSRCHATEALDYFTHFFGYRRRNIRFYVP